MKSEVRTFSNFLRLHYSSYNKKKKKIVIQPRVEKKSRRAINNKFIESEKKCDFRRKT